MAKYGTIVKTKSTIYTDWTIYNREVIDMEYIKPTTAKLVDMNKERSNKKAYIVRKVVFDFLHKGYPITINAVAQASGVSRQTIYSNQELINLIEYYGKYVQRCTQVENVEEHNILMAIPDIQTLEEDVSRLLIENRELNEKLFELKNELFALENEIEE